MERAVVMHSPHPKWLPVELGVTSEEISDVSPLSASCLLFANEPIRRDLSTLAQSLRAPCVSEQTRWKLPLFFKFWKKYHVPFLRRHLRAQRELFFPWVRAQGPLPECFAPRALAEAHREADRLMHEVTELQDELMEALTVESWQSTTAELRRRFAAHAEHTERLLAEEERLLPPLLPQRFSEAELERMLREHATTGLGLAAARRMIPWILDGVRLWGGEARAEALCAALPAPLRFLLARSWVPAFERKNRGLLALLFAERAPPAVCLPFNKM